MHFSYFIPGETLTSYSHVRSLQDQKIALDVFPSWRTRDSAVYSLAFSLFGFPKITLTNRRNPILRCSLCARERINSSQIFGALKKVHRFMKVVPDVDETVDASSLTSLQWRTIKKKTTSNRTADENGVSDYP